MLRHSSGVRGGGELYICINNCCDTSERPTSAAVLNPAKARGVRVQHRSNTHDLGNDDEVVHTASICLLFLLHTSGRSNTSISVSYVNNSHHVDRNM